MDEIDKTDMSELTKFRLNELSKIQDYFKSIDIMEIIYYRN